MAECTSWKWSNGYMPPPKPPLSVQPKMEIRIYRWSGTPAPLSISQPHSPPFSYEASSISHPITSFERNRASPSSSTQSSPSKWIYGYGEPPPLLPPTILSYQPPPPLVSQISPPLISRRERMGIGDLSSDNCQGRDPVSEFEKKLGNIVDERCLWQEEIEIEAMNRKLVKENKDSEAKVSSMGCNELKNSDIAINPPYQENEYFHVEPCVPNPLKGVNQSVEEVLDELKESLDVKAKISKVRPDYAKLQIDYLVVKDLNKCCEGNGVLVSVMDEKMKGIESLVQQDEEEFLKVENFQKFPKVMVGSLLGNYRFAEVDLMLDIAFDRIDVKNGISIEAGVGEIGFLQNTISYHAFGELYVQDKHFSSLIGSIIASYAAAHNVFVKMSA